MTGGWWRWWWGEGDVAASLGVNRARWDGSAPESPELSAKENSASVASATPRELRGGSL